MSNLNSQTINGRLSRGFISEGIRKDGTSMTIVAVFNGITDNPVVKLQQSVEGRIYQDIPKSAVILEARQENQMWNESILPEGTFIRVVVGEDTNGEIEMIKTLIK